MDGNGNIEHAWNDFIRIDEQGLNRIKLDGGKQWIMNEKWIEIMDIYINIAIYKYNDYSLAVPDRNIEWPFGNRWGIL